MSVRERELAELYNDSLSVSTNTSQTTISNDASLQVYLGEIPTDVSRFEAGNVASTKV